MEIIKLMMLALIVVLVCTFLKNLGSSFHTYIAVTACVMIMLFVLLKMTSLIESINRFSSYLKHSDKYIEILIKTVFITYITSFTSDICKDSGYNSIADQIELFGRVSIILLSVPVIFELLDMTVVQALGAEMTESDSYDYDVIDKTVKNTGIDRFSFKTLITDIMDGSFSFRDYIKNIISEQFNDITAYRIIFSNIVVLSVFSGIFKILSSSGSINTDETSQFIIITNLILILTKIFYETFNICTETLKDTLSVYQSIMPVFLSSVAVITGSVTYAAYYQVILLGISVVNTVFLNIILNGIKADYYLRMINAVSKTDRFSKLSDLIELLIKWTCRIVVVIFTGMGCVKGIMAPVSDSFKRKMFYKSAKIIPGIGDSIDAMSSAVYGSGIIIKNGIGIGGIAVIFFLMAAPLFKILINYLLLKITSAILQPMADKAFIQIIDKTAGIIGLMMLIVSITGFLFIILTALICAFTNNIN